MSMTLKTTKNMCCGLSVVFKITIKCSTIDVRKKSDLFRKNRTTGSPADVRKIWDWPQPANWVSVSALYGCTVPAPHEGSRGTENRIARCGNNQTHNFTHKMTILALFLIFYVNFLTWMQRIAAADSRQDVWWTGACHVTTQFYFNSMMSKIQNSNNIYLWFWCRLTCWTQDFRNL